MQLETHLKCTQNGFISLKLASRVIELLYNVEFQVESVYQHTV